MSMPVARGSRPRRDDHKRSKGANDPHHVCKHFIAVPFCQSLSPRFTETEIECTREVLSCPVEPSGCHQLFCSNHAERFVEFRSDQVLPPITSRERKVSS